MAGRRRAASSIEKPLSWSSPIQVITSTKSKVYRGHTIQFHIFIKGNPGLQRPNIRGGLANSRQGKSFRVNSFRQGLDELVLVKNRRVIARNANVRITLDGLLGDGNREVVDLRVGVSVEQIEVEGYQLDAYPRQGDFQPGAELECDGVGFGVCNVRSVDGEVCIIDEPLGDGRYCNEEASIISMNPCICI